MTVASLQDQPYELLHALRASEPVSWVPALNGWLVTDRSLAIAAMRDAVTFTVDDPRFSTAAVLGPSMLSLDGVEHDRHRSPFSPSFRPGIVRDQFEGFLEATVADLLESIVDRGISELRTALAGPLAVATITRFLGMFDVEPRQVLDWYLFISQAIVDTSQGAPISDGGRAAVAQIRLRVAETIRANDKSVLSEIEQSGLLTAEEMASDAAVLMFGAIETSEGMTANVLWHLLANPSALEEVLEDRSLIGVAIEESLRLEPAAAVIDRYATVETTFGDALIRQGDLVMISLLAANRDPAVFNDPDRFDLGRQNSRQHVTFVQGPHGCLGIHLARLETHAAVSGVLNGLPRIALDPALSEPPTGLIFRKPQAVTARWTPP